MSVPGLHADGGGCSLETEIERKFLVQGVPDLTPAIPAVPIAQGYLALEPGGIEVRIRRKDQCFAQTIKRGSGLKRLETEVPLSRDQFEQLWPHTAGRRVRKDRYEIPYRGRVIELDIFHGALEGLIMAEVEFDSAETAAAFEPPEWFAEEVTGDAQYSNQTLAQMGMPVL